MYTTIACVLLLLLLQPTHVTGASDRVLFETYTGFCAKKTWWGHCTRWVEDASDCTFWIKNGGSYGSRKKLGQHRWSSIGLDGSLTTYQHTYVWTTCQDSLWVDYFTLYSHESANVRLRYGANNFKGFCLSERSSPDKSWMTKYIPAKRCYHMFKFGKLNARDTRVWGYNRHFGDSPRRALTEADVQEVRDCENSAVDVTKECAHLVKKFMEVEGEDDDDWSLILPIEQMVQYFERFEKTEDGEVEREVMIPILMEVSNGDETDSQRVFEEADKNKNGSLDFSEFKVLLGLVDEHVNLSYLQELLTIANREGLKKLQQ